MNCYTPLFADKLKEDSPDAIAWIRGNADHPELNGIIRFFSVSMGGVLVNVEIFGLPDEEEQTIENDSVVSNFYAMHIHETGDCTGAFENTGMHYNPKGVAHPEHAGDMPPLISNDGYAWLAFYDDRISVEEILGRSVIIHGGRDDFTTQPSGDAGTKIGCGVIETS